MEEGTSTRSLQAQRDSATPAGRQSCLGENGSTFGDIRLNAAPWLPAPPAPAALKSLSPKNPLKFSPPVVAREPMRDEGCFPFGGWQAHSFHNHGGGAAHGRARSRGVSGHAADQGTV